MPKTTSVPNGLWPITDLRIGRVLLSAIRTAPRWGQIVIAGATLGVAAITAIAAAGLIGTHRSGVQQQLLSVIIAHTGLLLLGTAIFLYRLTQQAGRWQVILRRPDNIGTPRLHGLLLALPLVAFVAGSMLAAATALLIPTMLAPGGFPFMVIGAIYLVIVVLAANTVSQTTRFLYQQARQQAEAAAAAERDASNARLAALQAQMNPHFLFNALNTVAALISTHPARAERTVEHLAAVLRRTLDRSRTPLSTVAEEVDYVRAYLAIERERFGERLHVEWHVDPGVGSATLPPLSVQPLVENALKYAVGSTLKGGKISISAARQAEHISLSVHDDGPGFTGNRPEGTGISNLRKRIEAMFGDRGGLSITSQPGDTTVTILIPND